MSARALPSSLLDPSLVRPALVDALSTFLAADQLPTEVKNLISAHVATISMTPGGVEPAGLARVREAVFLIASSPDGAVLL